MTELVSQHFYLGLCLAISSSFFIGTSFIIKKKALIRLRKNGSIRASSGGLGYLKEGTWWLGFIFLGLGECLNFTAYAFAPASLVTPLGVLSVLVTALLASYFLQERLNLLGKLGCLLCILGSTIIVIHSPKEENVESLQELITKLQKPLFITYVFLIIIMSLFIIFKIAPKYGRRNISVYILLCSGIGSLSVMSCKALGLALKDALISESNSSNNALIFAFALIVVLCISIQMNYLNRALDIFNTSVVTPVYYVIFTTLVITASSILFEEWTKLSSFDIIGNLCGFFTVIIAIVLLNTFRDLDISMSVMKNMFRPKHDLISYSDEKYDEDINT